MSLNEQIPRSRGNLQPEYLDQTVMNLRFVIPAFLPANFSSETLQDLDTDLLKFLTSIKLSVTEKKISIAACFLHLYLPEFDA